MEAQTAATVRTIARPRHRGLPLSERRMLLAGLDLLAVGLAYILAFNLRTAPVRGESFYVPKSGTLIVMAVWLLAAQMMNAYDLRRAAVTRSTVTIVLSTVAVSAGGLLVLFFAFPYRLTRPTILIWVPLAAVLTLLCRLIYSRTLATSRTATPIALVASPRVIETIWPDVRSQVSSLYRVRSVIDPGKPDALGRLDRLIGAETVDEIVLGVRDDVSRDLFASLVRCCDNGLRVRSLADLYEEVTGRLLLDQLGHSWLMSIPMRSDSSRVYRFSKRLVDIAASSVALCVLGLVLPFVAVATWVGDRGPLFHRQERVGRYGRTFQLTKLRTMSVNRARLGSGEWTAEKDPRITRVGRVLRTLHLDELPQAWSILRGEMSLIGPRPEQPHYVDQLRESIDFYNTRLTVAPGLTGWAQVNYGYGAGVDGARVKLSYDLYYIKRQSVALDMLILARTLASVLSLSGR